MSDGAPQATGSPPQSSTVASPKQLSREAASLGLILLATLSVAILERRVLIPWAGYPSSLLLLVLSVWHKWRFGVAVRIFPVRSARRTLPLALSIAFAAILMLAAGGLPQPWSERVPSPFEPLHLLVLVPLSEELYFRGLLFEHLRKGFTALRATLLCSLLFAILHLPFTATLTAGALSLIACLLVLRTGTLACALQLHVAWNALVEIHSVGDRSSRWVLAILASALIVSLAFAWSRDTRRSPSGDAH